MINTYLDIAKDLITRVRDEEGHKIELAGKKMADALEQGKLVHAFGGHLNLYPQELFYRAGGIVPINPIMPPALIAQPGSHLYQKHLNRDENFAKMMVAQQNLNKGDILVVASIAGKTLTAIELAKTAQEKGVFVIAIQSIPFSSQVESGHSSGKLVGDYADVVIDCKAPYGDAVLDLGNGKKAAAISSVVGFSIAQALATQAVCELGEREITPPVYVSSNLDKGDAINKRHLEKYHGVVNFL
ncbi:sugar isomerase domain-containing protein [Vibrio sp. Hep-1b-8]|uniref:sugar isomerase domain-containing protein n=1 Tax=Vibrio sp. Hep-1b-8 TaxID=2144187 RepID=UPI00148655C4|nr:sugar isomerase domain-containing protein [Vibrio sp. Hep-1b-8]